MRLHEILAVTPVTEITKSSSISKDYTTTAELASYKKRATPTKVRIKGYRIFFVEEEDHDLLLVKDTETDDFLGLLQLERVSDFGSVSSVFFTPALQGKGVAVPLYAAAIKQLGYTIISDTEQTAGSRSLWARLAKTPGIFVYGWNQKADDDQFFQWDASIDPEEEVYYDPEAVDRIQQEVADFKQKVTQKMRSGEIDADDAQEAMADKATVARQQIKDLDQVRWADMRLVATAKKGLSK